MVAVGENRAPDRCKAILVTGRRRFGAVRKLPSGRYQASFIEPRSRQRVFGSETFATKRAAEHWLVDSEAKLNRGDLTDVILARTPFDEWAEHWLATPQVHPKTHARYRMAVRGLLVPEFANTPINSVDRSQVQLFIARLLDQPNGEARAKEARLFLSMIFTEATRSNALRINQVEGVRVKRSARSEMVFLSVEEVQRLANEVSFYLRRFRGGREERIDVPQYGLLVRFASQTGLRAGEIAALRVGRINVGRHLVNVVESVSEVSKKDAPDGLLYGPTKNYERRTVPMPSTLTAELAAHLATRPDDPAAFVFTSVLGAPLRHTNFYDRFYKLAVVQAGLLAETRFHDLRHSYAALLIAAGANPLTIKQRLGHSTITVTFDNYGHLFPHLE